MSWIQVYNRFLNHSFYYFSMRLCKHRKIQFFYPNQKANKHDNSHLVRHLKTAQWQGVQFNDITYNQFPLGFVSLISFTLTKLVLLSCRNISNPIYLLYHYLQTMKHKLDLLECMDNHGTRYPNRVSFHYLFQRIYLLVDPIWALYQQDHDDRFTLLMFNVHKIMLLKV